jgi:hypothetical protein
MLQTARFIIRHSSFIIILPLRRNENLRLHLQQQTPATGRRRAGIG